MRQRAAQRGPSGAGAVLPVELLDDVIHRISTGSRHSSAAVGADWNAPGSTPTRCSASSPGQRSPTCWWTSAALRRVLVVPCPVPRSRILLQIGGQDSAGLAEVRT
ncbi:unnamed protein product [Urochloa humidicola]